MPIYHYESVRRKRALAYLVLRPGGSVQIRESRRTERGPRSRTLVSFRGALDDGVLDEAERRAAGRLDRAALIARARELGVGWVAGANAAARQLVRRLRGGAAPHPLLVALLRDELAALPGREPDEALAEALEWVGSSDAERGAALRGLLRLGDAIARSRGSAPPAAPPYPVFAPDAAPGA